ncbi:hypothetical protein H9P43_006131 [Blastocladiella emersonii ATCC 22665]|nr:hypothetical protein H9P43_006131 [Blastocladiella emersonii ATCC 22665]
MESPKLKPAPSHNERLQQEREYSDKRHQKQRVDLEYVEHHRDNTRRYRQRKRDEAKSQYLHAARLARLLVDLCVPGLTSENRMRIINEYREEHAEAMGGHVCVVTDELCFGNEVERLEVAEFPWAAMAAVLAVPKDVPPDLAAQYRVDSLFPPPEFKDVNVTLLALSPRGVVRDPDGVVIAAFFKKDTLKHLRDIQRKLESHDGGANLNLRPPEWALANGNMTGSIDEIDILTFSKLRVISLFYMNAITCVVAGGTGKALTLHIHIHDGTAGPAFVKVLPFVDGLKEFQVVFTSTLTDGQQAVLRKKYGCDAERVRAAVEKLLKFNPLYQDYALCEKSFDAPESINDKLFTEAYDGTQPATKDLAAKAVDATCDVANATLVGKQAQMDPHDAKVTVHEFVSGIFVQDAPENEFEAAREAKQEFLKSLKGGSRAGDADAFDDVTGLSAGDGGGDVALGATAAPRPVESPAAYGYAASDDHVDHLHHRRDHLTRHGCHPAVDDSDSESGSDDDDGDASDLESTAAAATSATFTTAAPAAAAAPPDSEAEKRSDKRSGHAKVIADAMYVVQQYLGNQPTAAAAAVAAQGSATAAHGAATPPAELLNDSPILAIRHPNKYADLHDQDWLALFFVHLFPFGRGGLHDRDRKNRFSILGLIQHLLRVSTHRFSRDNDFILFMNGAYLQQRVAPQDIKSVASVTEKDLDVVIERMQQARKTAESGVVLPLSPDQQGTVHAIMGVAKKQWFSNGERKVFSDNVFASRTSSSR